MVWCLFLGGGEGGGGLGVSALDLLVNCLAFPGWTNQILPPFYAYTCTSGITRQTKTTKSPRRFWVKQPKIVKVMAGGSLLILSALCILVLVTGEKKGPKVTEKVQIENVYIKVTPPTLA